MSHPFLWGVLVGFLIGAGLLLVVVRKRGAASAQAISDGIATAINKAREDLH